MIVGRKVRLIPDKEQEKWLYGNWGCHKFIYNYSLGIKIDRYKADGFSMKQKDLMNIITPLKYTEGYEWLQDYGSETIKQAVKDMLSAYTKFFQRRNIGFPKFKTKKYSTPKFYLRYDRLYSVDDKHLRLPGYKKPFKVAEKTNIIEGTIKNPRVQFDGKFWYLSYSYEINELKNDSNLEENLGIDLGLENLATISDGRVYRNINRDKNVLNLEKRKRLLQRKISRAYEKNKEGNKYVKTNNIIKMERQVKLIDRKLTNIKDTYIHQVTYDLVKTKPKSIIIEDLGVSNMMKNKHLAKSIQDSKWRFFRDCLTYKCQYYGVDFIVADRFFPSSKRCNCCGNKKKYLPLNIRTYKCDMCGYTEHRDLNAAYNLRDYMSLK